MLVLFVEESVLVFVVQNYKEKPIYQEKILSLHLARSVPARIILLVNNVLS